MPPEEHSLWELLVVLVYLLLANLPLRRRSNRKLHTMEDRNELTLTQ